MMLLSVVCVSVEVRRHKSKRNLRQVCGAGVHFECVSFLRDGLKVSVLFPAFQLSAGGW